MAEGVARLNQQVVSTDYWDQSPRVDSLGRIPGSRQKDLAQGNRPYSLRDVRRVVESDIIPRLLLGHEQSPRVSGGPGGEGALSQPDIQHFAGLLLSQRDDVAVSAFLVEIQERGLPIDAIYLDLFQPAARYIGELWHADQCTFVDVTLAIGTMQRLLRTFEPEFHKNARPPDGARLAMLAPLPGDQHTFGLSMVAEFFRRGGWSVWTTPFATLDALGEHMQASWFAVVGFSASREDRLEELASVIRMVRRKSCNGSVGILVGGPVFVDRPDLVARVGADVVGRNAIQALAEAEEFVAPVAGR